MTVVSRISSDLKRVENNDELEMEEEKCSLDAAESCPVMIIHVYENGEDLL